jgi:hypothetical protein
MARGSAMESASHLDVVRWEQLITGNTYAEAIALLESIGAMLTHLSILESSTLTITWAFTFTSTSTITWAITITFTVTFTPSDSDSSVHARLAQVLARVSAVPRRSVAALVDHQLRQLSTGPGLTNVSGAFWFA